MKTNSLILGIASGFIGPVIGFFIYYFMVFRHKTLTYLINYAINSHLLSALLSISLIANLALFFIFLKFNKDISARGVLLMTIIYAIVGFGLKFFM